MNIYFNLAGNHWLKKLNEGGEKALQSWKKRHHWLPQPKTKHQNELIKLYGKMNRALTVNVVTSLMFATATLTANPFWLSEVSNIEGIYRMSKSVASNALAGVFFAQSIDIIFSKWQEKGLFPKQWFPTAIGTRVLVFAVLSPFILSGNTIATAAVFTIGAGSFFTLITNKEIPLGLWLKRLAARKTNLRTTNRKQPYNRLPSPTFICKKVIEGI